MMEEKPKQEQGDRGEHEFTKPIVLAVEGADEHFLIRALLASEKLQGRMDFHPLKGNDNLPVKLTALRNTGNFRVFVSTLGVVIDAEEREVEDAISSVSNALRAAFGCPLLPGPGVVMEWEGKPPRLGAFILPDGQHPGSLEDLCLRAEAVRTDEAMECVDAYLKCLAPLLVDSTRALQSKRRLHAYLASRPTPGLKIGEAATERCWHFEDPVWAPLKQFLRDLVGA